MAGFRIKVNEKELVSVSNEDFNILTVQVQGDVLGDELAEIEMHGGYYGEDKPKTHYIWLNGYEVKESDEIEIEFLENLETSTPGKTIEELFPENDEKNETSESMEELFSYLSQQPRKRQGFSIELEHSSGDIKRCLIPPEDYSFMFIIMWKWHAPERASVSLTSNTLEGVAKQKSGTAHARAKLSFGEGVKIRVGT